mmetsp:Transcript_20942/g.51459  ORF Transcript_20942/g.51459 Transcript_20942/m.51459 type:complete len:635 (+) Transcript_20942:95-1999(+)
MVASIFTLRFATQRLRSATAIARPFGCLAHRRGGGYLEANNHINKSGIRFLASTASSDEFENVEEMRGKTIVSKDDEHHEETQRRRLADVLISEVLDAKHAHRWVNPIIDHDATLREAIETVIDGGLSGMMVVDVTDDDQKKVLGLLTSRDLLRIMNSGIKDDESNDEIMNRPIADLMTPISQVVYARPDETIGMCRTIMAKLGIKCLPILSNEGQVAGLITARDMSDFGLTAAEKGGKKSFLDDVSQRVGLSSNTSMADPPLFMQAHLSDRSPLYVNVGVAELPHPFKTQDGVSGNRRDHGPRDATDDLDLSEDAHFVATVKLQDEKEQALRDLTYFGVADGVGSWREYGVDPREFSHKLMEECENVLLESCYRAQRKGTKKSKRIIAPADILEEAYERVKKDNTIGSCTACVAFFDNYRHQLHFSNLGDSGIIVLRHIDSDVAGSLKRDKTTPRLERKSDLRVAFVSQQQLHSFNHPYQLGWTGEEMRDESSFNTAQDTCTTSIHVRRGDIIIMATDGLFDNVDVDEIAEVGLEWENQVGLIRGGDIAAREKRWRMGNSLTLLSAERVGELALELCEKAREYSLDSATDSPFAILAKENDIMWSGGMPDDCTVIVAHVVGRSADDVMDKDNQ